MTLWMNCLSRERAQRARCDVKAKLLGQRFGSFAANSS